MRERLLKEVQRISGLPIPTGIRAGGKRRRDVARTDPLRLIRVDPSRPSNGQSFKFFSPAAAIHLDPLKASP